MQGHANEGDRVRESLDEELDPEYEIEPGDFVIELRDGVPYVQTAPDDMTDQEVTRPE